MASQPMPHRLERSVVIHAARDVVFNYFTDSTRWARWWGKGSTIDPRSGGAVLIVAPRGRAGGRRDSRNRPARAPRVHLRLRERKPDAGRRLGGHVPARRRSAGHAPQPLARLRRREGARRDGAGLALPVRAVRRTWWPTTPTPARARRWTAGSPRGPSRTPPGARRCSTGWPPRKCASRIDSASSTASPICGRTSPPCTASCRACGSSARATCATARARCSPTGWRVAPTGRSAAAAPTSLPSATTAASRRSPVSGDRRKLE